MQNKFRLLLLRLINTWLTNVGLTQTTLLDNLHGHNYPYTSEEIDGFLSGSSEPPGTFFAHLILCNHVNPREHSGAIIITDWRNNQVSIWSELLGKAYMEEIVPLISIDGEIGEGWEQVRQIYIDHIVLEYDREMRWNGYKEGKHT